LVSSSPSRPSKWRRKGGVILCFGGKMGGMGMCFR
jgi:hypothetical protein